MTIAHEVLLTVNIPNMTRWVERLERNEDPQTIGLLHRLEDSLVGGILRRAGYCCLGIAAEEAANDGASAQGRYDGGGTASYALFDEISSVLPPSVNQWLGWGNNQTGTYDEAKCNSSNGGALTLDNDQQGKTFPEIAAIVRREWLTPAIAAQASVVSAETK